MAHITRDQLSAACRAHDNAAEIGETFDEMVAKRGLATPDAVHVAGQRALRMVLLFSGRKIPHTGVPTPVALSEDEIKLADMLTAAWLDGLVVGIKVSE